MSTQFERNHPFISYRLPVLLYALVIFGMSSITGYDIPHLPFLSFDKLIHFIEFGLFGIFLYRAYRFPRALPCPYLLTLVTGIPYAALDEIHQLFVPGRNCSLADFLADTLGIIVFAGISAWLHRNKTREMSAG